MTKCDCGVYARKELNHEGEGVGRGEGDYVIIYALKLLQASRNAVNNLSDVRLCQNCSPFRQWIFLN